MFTGIIKEVGKVSRIVKNGDLMRLGIVAPDIYPDAKISDSIAVNGVCLTLVSKDKRSLFFEAIKTTHTATNLKRLRIGSIVNLEPALKVGDNVGGHFVLGHVDVETRLLRKMKYKDWLRYEISLPPKDLRKFILENGSIALEGISLTVKKVSSSYFTVHIIPFTHEHTNLKYKRAGDWLNLETDYLLKRR